MSAIEHDHHHEHNHDHDHAHHHEDEGINWERVQKWAQTGLLFLLALYFIDLSLPNGNLGNYINVANFGWLIWVGAAILLSIAGINTYDLLRQTNHHDHHHHHDHDHDHAPAGSWGSWLFLGLAALPLVMGLGIPSKPLGADAVNDLSSDVRAIGISGDSAVEAVPPENRNLLDWIRAFSTTADLTQFEGETVNVIGFVYRDARFAGTTNFMVVRFTLSCCVADARPIGLIVENTLPEDFPQDTWVSVTGKVVIRSMDGVDTPVILSETIVPTTEPEQPYLYF